MAADGGIFAFNAPFYGSTGSIRLNQPIIGMAATPSGLGYWLVAADGGVFTFGDAKYFGSMGARRLNRPVVAVAADSLTGGYWLVAADGGIFSFDASFYGSTGAIHLNKPIVGMASTSNGGGYWLVASDGGLFTFGDAPYLGSTGASPGPAPIVAMTATTHGFPFPPGSTGYDISNFQCNDIPAIQQQISIVQVTGGAINNSPNPCYAREAAWAGTRLSAYVFVDGLPSPPPPESLSGPAGACGGNVICESYNFGWYWASHWVGYSHSTGVSPTLWWLDIETSGSWNLNSSAYASNSNVIAGALAALKADGAAGIYSTAYQWSRITGNSVSFPGIPLWVPGGGNISGGTFSAESICAGTAGTLYSPFASGNVVVVQYGYTGNGYSGPPSNYDQDYACT